MENKEQIRTLVAFILLIIFFMPLVWSGLFSDDLQNFQTKTLHYGRTQGLMELSIPLIQVWQKLGRFTPVSLMWQEFIFKHITSIIVYKCLVLFMNLLGALSFMVFLSSLTKKVNTAVWIISYIAVCQFRITYHDAYTSFNGMYQLLACVVFLGLTAYVRYVTTGKQYFFVLSVICYVIGIMVSEMGLISLLMIPAIAFKFRVPLKKNFLKQFIIYLLPTFMFLAYTAYLRAHVIPVNTYPGLVSNYNLRDMISLFIRQAYASIPLSNLHHKPAIPEVLLHQLQNPWILMGFIIIFVNGIYLLLKARQSSQKKLRFVDYRLFIVILVLMICPGGIIVPSMKYQQEVMWGVGYLPVYFQNFGSSLLLAYFFQISINRFGEKAFLSRVIATVIIVCAGATFLFNKALMDGKTFMWSAPAQALFETVKTQHVLDSCENGSTIFLGNNFFWESPEAYGNLFKAATNNDFEIYDFEEELPVRTSQPCYFLDCHSGNPIVISIYRMNCDERTKTEKLGEWNVPCDIRISQKEISLF